MRKAVMIGLVAALAVAWVFGFFGPMYETPGLILGIGELTFSNPPALNQTAVLTYRVDNPNIAEHFQENGWLVSVRIVLPEGLIWISGGENSVISESRLIENRRICKYPPVKDRRHSTAFTL
jgi:hypothetical protein